MVTIAFGWWLAPLAITFAVWIWFAAHRYDGGYYGADVIAMMKFAVAIILTLAAWLIWALLS